MHDAKLDEILRLLRLLVRGEIIIMTTQAEFDARIKALNAKVTAETDAEKAVITLLGGLSQQVKDLKSQLTASNPTLDLSGLDAIGASIDANATASAAAVVANTDAAP